MSSGYAGTKRGRLKRRAFLAWLKAGMSCGRCLSVVHPCALDFDHDGEKGHNVGSIANRGTTIQMLREIANGCVPLCSNCHRLKTYAPEVFEEIPFRRKPITMASLLLKFKRWERRCWQGGEIP